jgi:hypothetical protein
VVGKKGRWFKVSLRRQERMEFDEPDFALIDTLFSLAEAHLFMQLVELQDSRPEVMPPGKSYADIYRCAPTSIATSAPLHNPAVLSG